MFTNRTAIPGGVFASFAASLSQAAIAQIGSAAVVANSTEDFSGFASSGNAAYDQLIHGNGLSGGFMLSAAGPNGTTFGVGGRRRRG